MIAWLQTLVLVAALLLPLSACRLRIVAEKNGPPQAKLEAVPPKPKEAEEATAKLPDTIGLPREAYRDGGPHIMIWVNGQLYVDTTLRDSEEVSPDQLGNYLARVLFTDTKKVRIRADDSDPKKANLKAKCELRLAVGNSDSNGSSAGLLRISFDEMRFRKAPYDPGAWVLAVEGIELIEKAIPKKKSDP